LDYTILKPGVFMEVWIGAVVGIPLQAGQPVTLVGKGNHQHAFVSVGDVAKYAVTAVSHAAARNKAIRIAGPVSYTWTEIVETTGQVLGQSLPINYMPMGETVPLIPEMMSSMLSGFETYESGIDMNETASIYGIQPTPLAVFAERFFKG
ncbi:MAG: NmrA family NAD(P)-binding protein, partial [Anaerolineales bacterium]|nr:NmrA family NAD(P)-binding protein [Anaerolineales bacterium]